MSSLRGSVGRWEFTWKAVPRGTVGVTQIEVRSPQGGALRTIELRWWRDTDGLWLELPDGARGFDIQIEAGDDGRPVYRLSERGGPGLWEGLAYVRAGEERLSGASAGARKNARVRAQMPGKILRIHVKAGDIVEKGQALLVMEAMKMENEIRAPQSGRIDRLKISEGQAVETGADLCEIA